MNWGERVAVAADAMAGMAENEVVSAVDALTVTATLPEPIRFRDWVVKEREYLLVAVTSSSGRKGYCHTLTRGAPLAAMVTSLIAPAYRDRQVSAPHINFDRARRGQLATLSAGAGLRALSVVDVAMWDLAAKSLCMSLEALFGRSPREATATVVVGYPPAAGASHVERQVTVAMESGWRHVKLPLTGDEAHDRDRIRAARSAGASVSVDAAWAFRGVGEAAEFLENIGVDLEWFEDIFPPGQVEDLECLRRLSSTPIAFGDEQGDPYFPTVLLRPRRLDVLRLDATVSGGITSMVSHVAAADAAGIPVATHMFPQAHGPIMSALSDREFRLEWGLSGTGVDPYADGLPGLGARDGRLLPPERRVGGIGVQFNRQWLDEQQVEGDLDVLGSNQGEV